MPSKTLSPEVRSVLARATCTDNVLRLPSGQLDRKLYVAVADAIEALGGKWNKKAGAHLFDGEVAPKLAALLDDGIVPVKNPDAFFETPPEVVRQVVAAAVLDDIPSQGLRVLEPSAGKGAIALGLSAALSSDATLDTVELNPERAAILRNRGFWVHEGDFLAYSAEPYDLIAMNPPFAITGDATAWITHVRHALTLLRPGGRLVAIVPAGIVHRADKKHQAIRALFDAATVEPLHPNAFKSSGTGVNACLLTYDHPTDAECAA
jgi:predicted RNA methylase